jgi:hypothetical protein
MDYMLSGYASAIIWFKRATQINIKNYQDEKHEQIIIFFHPGTSRYTKTGACHTLYKIQLIF